MWFLCFPVLTGSAEAQVIWGGIVKHLLIVYFIGNISAKKYPNPFMCIKVIASQRWDVFWDTVYFSVYPLKHNLFNTQYRMTFSIFSTQQKFHRGYVSVCQSCDYCVITIIYWNYDGRLCHHNIMLLQCNNTTPHECTVKANQSRCSSHKHRKDRTVFRTLLRRSQYVISLPPKHTIHRWRFGMA